jgi:hypothetical protein
MEKPGLLDRAWTWVSTLPLATLITLLGLFFYTSLARDYEAFYGSLSVPLQDIGLNYAAVLARSGDQIVTPLFLIVLSYSLLRRARQAATEGEWRAGRAHTGRWRRLRVSRAWSKTYVLITLGLVVILVFGLYVIDLYSRDEEIKAATTAVRDGQAIEGIESKSGFTVLNVHVREAQIEPVAKTNVAPSISGLVGRRMLYVGQADGTLVLFDPAADRAVYVPRNSVTLSVGSE